MRLRLACNQRKVASLEVLETTPATVEIRDEPAEFCCAALKYRCGHVAKLPSRGRCVEEHLKGVLHPLAAAANTTSSQ